MLFIQGRSNPSALFRARENGIWGGHKKTGSFEPVSIKMGWMMGVEPTTPGTTIRCSAIELHPPGKSRVCKTEQKELRSAMKISLYSKKNSGTPEGIRTPDPQLRRLLLYPAELLAQILVAAQGLEPRTCGL